LLPTVKYEEYSADCKKQIRFERIDETENEDEQVLDNYIPLVVLPNSGEVIAPHLRVAWKGTYK
jgi:hypothetical protein